MEHFIPREDWRVHSSQNWPKLNAILSQSLFKIASNLNGFRRRFIGACD